MHYVVQPPINSVRREAYESLLLNTNEQPAVRLIRLAYQPPGLHHLPPKPITS
jgi:hypothetical protein